MPGMTYRIAVDGEQESNRKVQGFRGELDKTDAAFGKFSQSGASAFSQVGGSLTQLIGTLGGLKLLQDGLTTAFDFQRARIGLKAFLGDAQAAQQLFSQIQDFAQESPFEFKDLLQGSTRLLAFNVAAKDVVPTLKAISAAGGALGFDRGKINDLIVALGQIKSAGKLTGEELRQLRNAGIPALNYLAAAFGKTSAEIEKAIEKGLVPADAAIKALVSGMANQFGKFNAEVSQSASVAVSNFRDAMGRLADDVFARYLPAITKFITNTAIPALQAFAEWWTKNQDAIETFGKVVAAIATAGIFYKLAAGIQSVTAAMLALNVASLANPWALAAAGVGLLTLAVIDLDKKNKEAMDSLSKLAAEKEIRNLVSKGNDLTDLQQIYGYSAGQVKDALGGKGMGDTGGFNLGLPVSVKTGNSQAERLKFMANLEEERKKLEDAQKNAGKFWMQAEEQEVSGIKRIMREYQNKMREWGLTEKARTMIGMGTAAELRKLQLKEASDYGEVIQKKAELDREYWIKRFQMEQEAQAQILDLQMRTSEGRANFQLEELQLSRDAQIRAAEAANVGGLGENWQQQLQRATAFETQKASIEEKFLMDSFATKMRLLDLETSARIAAEAQVMRAKGISEDVITGMTNARLEAAGEQARQIELSTQGQLDAVRQGAAIRQAQMVRDAYQNQFQQLKSSVGSLLDNMLGQTRSWADTFKTIFRSAILAPIKEAISTWIAGLLMGQRIGFAGPGGGAAGGQGGGGLFGGFAGLLGMGGTGGFAGGFGGTPPFIAGPGGAPGGGGFGQIGGAAGGLAGLKGGFGGMLSSLGNIGFNSAAGPFSVGQNVGVYGAKGGAMLAGGGLLAMDGLRRGGLLGTLETTAGGALIGAKFGGPIGAAIGAGIGLTAGLIRNMFKGATEKAKEAVKRVYNVSLTDQGILQQVVKIAKDGFGGNIDIAVRSQQVRELIELYAMSTGQNPQGALANVPRAFNVTSSGGVLSQDATFINGRGYTADSVFGPQAGLAGLGVIPTSGGTNITLSLDGPTTERVLQGQAAQFIGSNPGAVVDAQISAAQSSYRRNEQRAVSWEPFQVVG
jgi:tape measure domain-containing protein